MSYRSNKGRNNVTYLHKNKKNNPRTSKNKKVNKKRKINKAKLSIFICIFIVCGLKIPTKSST